MEILDNDTRFLSAEQDKEIGRLQGDAFLLLSPIKNAKYLVITVAIFSIFSGLDSPANLIFTLLYFISAFTIKRYPKNALLLATVLYIGALGSALLISPGKTLNILILVKALIAYFIVNGLINAYKLEEINKKLKVYGEEHQVFE